jgi:hypothetical protein
MHNADSLMIEWGSPTWHCVLSPVVFNGSVAAGQTQIAMFSKNKRTSSKSASNLILFQIVSS